MQGVKAVVTFVTQTNTFVVVEFTYPDMNMTQKADVRPECKHPLNSDINVSGGKFTTVKRKYDPPCAT